MKLMPSILKKVTWLINWVDLITATSQASKVFGFLVQMAEVLLKRYQGIMLFSDLLRMPWIQRLANLWRTSITSMIVVAMWSACKRASRRIWHKIGTVNYLLSEEQRACGGQKNNRTVKQFCNRTASLWLKRGNCRQRKVYFKWALLPKRKRKQIFIANIQN